MASYVIKIGRFKKECPDFLKRLHHPLVEMFRPQSYNLFEEVEPWLHEEQKKKDASVPGKVIYHNITKEEFSLASQLSFMDGLEIIKIVGRDLMIFREIFGSNTTLTLWGSKGEDYLGYPCVPVLREEKGGLVIKTKYLNSFWTKECPGLRFNKK